MSRKYPFLKSSFTSLEHFTWNLQYISKFSSHISSKSHSKLVFIEVITGKLWENLLSCAFVSLNYNTEKKNKNLWFCTSQYPDKYQNREAFFLTHLQTYQPLSLHSGATVYKLKNETVETPKSHFQHRHIISCSV